MTFWDKTIDLAIFCKVRAEFAKMKFRKGQEEKNKG